MAQDQLRVLLVEDSREYARLIKLTLSVDERFTVETATTLAEGLQRLNDEPFDIALVDLTLPDASGTDTFRRALEQAPHVPIVVLTGMDDERLAMEAVHLGAQDYLVKGSVEDEHSLSRALRYAVERHRMQAELREQALVDELTGLYNRRGFTTLANHQLIVSARSGSPAAVLFIDIDGMKMINDSLGHPEGDRALLDTATILRNTFRKSDVVARLGGDEFCALLMNCSEQAQFAALGRLWRNVAMLNESVGRLYKLSVSVGAARYDPESPRPIDELIREADARMYEQKARLKTP